MQDEDIEMQDFEQGKIKNLLVLKQVPKDWDKARIQKFFGSDYIIETFERFHQYRGSPSGTVLLEMKEEGATKLLKFTPDQWFGIFGL